MKPLSFRTFINLLESTGELRTVTAEVDPVLELAAMTDRVCKSPRNEALLFKNVTESTFWAATNLYGSQQRMALALGVGSLDELEIGFDGVLASLPGRNSAEKLAALETNAGWEKAAPHIVEPPPQLVCSDIDLSRLPLPKSYPHDGEPDHDGRFITLGHVITSSTNLKERNCGIYRAAPINGDHLAISWSDTSGASLHAASWDASSTPMPVVIALGVPAALTLAATLPLPHGVNEFRFAGLLQGKPLELFMAGNGLPAPACAELIIEGYIQPGRIGGGAFGNHSGFYTPSPSARLLEVTAIRHAADMILPATIVGRPPMEDCWLARAGGKLLLSLLKTDVPEVTALHQPLAAIFHGAVAIAIKKSARDHATVINAIRNSRWFGSSRLMVIVDADDEPIDDTTLLWRLVNCAAPERDILLKEDKIFIDATVKPWEKRASIGFELKREGVRNR